MSMPLRKLEPETQVEQRLSRLEAHVEHLQSDVTDLKIDLRRLNDRMIQGFAELNEKIDRKIAWVVGLIVTLAAAGGTGFLWMVDRLNTISAALLGT